MWECSVYLYFTYNVVFGFVLWLQLFSIFVDSDPEKRGEIYAAIMLLTEPADMGGIVHFLNVNFQAQGLGTTQVYVAYGVDVMDPPPSQEFPYVRKSADWFRAQCTRNLLVAPYVAIETAILAISRENYANNDNYRRKWLFSYRFYYQKYHLQLMTRLVMFLLKTR